MATVKIPPVLRPSVSGMSEVEVEGATVGEVLNGLAGQHPETRDQLFSDDGELNRFVNVYVNDEDVRVQQGLETGVGAGDTVVILPAMAGGARPQPRLGRSRLFPMLEARPLREPRELLPRRDRGDRQHADRRAEAARPKEGVRLFAKLEFYNPTGSVKDRVAKSMIERAEAEGAIAPGQTILEPTSGNTGISLALICRLKGYPFTVVMPENVTAERTELLRMHGAEIVYSEGSKGSNGAVELALEMAEKDPSFYMPYQYGNQANPDAHYYGTAEEIIEELGDVTAFVAGLGTGGTLMGNGRRLKEHDPNTKIVAAEPLQGEDVQGLRSLDDGFIPPIIDLSVLDRKILVSNRDGIIWTRKLFFEEGIFAGVSSGAIASVAVRIANELDEGNVVFLVADDGNKYMSAGLWTKSIDELEAVDSTVWW